MENYNRHITAYMRRQNTELQSIVSMIADTVVRIGGGNSRSAERLQEIGKNLEEVAGLDDLRELKARLGECLHTFRDETQRQKAESDAAIQALHRELEQRAASAGAISADLHAMMEAARGGRHVYLLEETLHVEGRTVLVPIAAAWPLALLMPPVTLAAKQIQSFIAIRHLS
jgi:hypothetical protein